MLAESFLMNPISIGVKFVFRKLFVEGNRVKRAKLTSFGPGVAFDLKAFQ